MSGAISTLEALEQMLVKRQALEGEKYLLRTITGKRRSIPIMADKPNLRKLV